MPELDLPHTSSTLPPIASNIVGMTHQALQHALVDRAGVEPKKARMRASQIWRWVYNVGVTDFDRMTDIGKDLRARLSDVFLIDRPRIIERQVSVDGTRKYLLGFGAQSPGPEIEVEAVFIPGVGRAGALCVSSQVGCTLTCTFCHTGTQKLVRNLTAGEIVAQVLAAKDDIEEWPSGKDDRILSNIVFMGMGEPLENFDGVVSAIRCFVDVQTFGAPPIPVSEEGKRERGKKGEGEHFGKLKRLKRGKREKGEEWMPPSVLVA